MSEKTLFGSSKEQEVAYLLSINGFNVTRPMVDVGVDLIATFEKNKRRVELQIKSTPVVYGKCPDGKDIHYCLPVRKSFFCPETKEGKRKEPPPAHQPRDDYYFILWCEPIEYWKKYSKRKPKLQRCAEEIMKIARRKERLVFTVPSKK